MSLPPFTYAEIEEQLEDMYVELNPKVIERLTQFDIETQDTLLVLIGQAAATSQGLAYQFGERLSKALDIMELETIGLWLNQAIDAFDYKGLYGSIAKLDELESFAQHAQNKLTGIAFEDVCGVLEHFIQGLSGRRLKIDIDNHSYTDTETLYLPSMQNVFAAREDNFSLYKCTAVHLWAQTWYGTWHIEPAYISEYDNPEKALRWFHVLEAIRLDACIERELPGIHREMNHLCLLAEQRPLSELQLPDIEQLKQPQATASLSLEFLQQHYHQKPPPVAHYHGYLKPQQVEAVRTIRLAREKDLFRLALAQMLEEKTGKKAEQMSEAERALFSAERLENLEQMNGSSFKLELDGDLIQPPDNVLHLMDSIIQDLGLIPPEYLVAAGDGGYAMINEEEKKKTQNVWEGTYHEEGASLHREWDYRRKRYKKNWCAVRELDVHSTRSNFVDNTLNKYSGLVKSLRRTFEVLRGEDKTLKRQPYGDDIDIDALVETWADVQCGMEMSDNIFTKMHKEERNIAVIFMVDMSGSTKGWINEAEKESLVLLCEALEILGDRYAVYGFTGITRKRCEIYRVKSFADDYNDTTKGRISNITPQDYTRLGVFIRHFTEMFRGVEAKTKLLITLSDGKPEDYDGYRGEYGIEDTRMALIEARREGIHPFCITIDREARDYLQHMYGKANFVVIDEVNRLPLKVADIYRHITS
ncbi:MAG: nitric oxide reductase activation protein [Gammaproteobacteria bacterium]|nr:nitric oxide reductase activation protein [Gammaproteobacteria bacterium]